MNDQTPSTDFYEFFLLVYMYVKTNYYYYSGVMMRVALDYSKFNLKQIIAYIVVSGLLVDTTRRLLELNGSTAFITMFVCVVLGFIGDTPLRFILTEFMQDFMRAIKDKIIEKIKNK